jgi:hypothetical protein
VAIQSSTYLDTLSGRALKSRFIAFQGVGGVAIDKSEVLPTVDASTGAVSRT